MLIPETDYTKERGSVIIRLRPACLETLSADKHTLKANYTDGGSAETTFTIANASVKAESLPQTGDNSRLLLWIGLVISSMVAVFVFAKKESLIVRSEEELRFLFAREAVDYRFRVYRFWFFPD